MHRYPEGPRGAAAPRQLSGRGVAYWTDGRGDDRVLYVTPGYRLIALNAKTGVPDPVVRQERRRGPEGRRRGYGNGQQIDLETGEIGLHSTPTVVRDTIIVGSSMKEGMTITTHNNTKGLVRAFDARTGKVQWTFNTIPRPGEVGNDTWLNGSWAVNGNTGVWTQITVDEELGLVYLPVESPSSDYYGGKRPGNNLFGESLVCVDLKTGQRKWHFQLVHHPIWDHDISSAPILLDVTIDGKLRKLVAQPTKQTFLYVFDRVTGEPIWPIVETPVPPGDVPGEWYAPTQPIPSKPPAYGRPGLRIPDELIDFTPEMRAQAVENMKRYKWGGNYPVQRNALQPADRRQRQRIARRAQSRERQRRNQLAGRRRRSGDRHRLRAGEHVGVHTRVGGAAAARVLRYPLSGGRRRTAVPSARGRGHRDLRRRASRQQRSR